MPGMAVMQRAMSLPINVNGRGPGFMGAGLNGGAVQFDDCLTLA